MHVHHPDAQPRGGRDGAGDGVWNVVELQIEKHAIAARHELFDEARPFAREEAAADLEAADGAAEAVREATVKLDAYGNRSVAASGGIVGYIYQHCELQGAI